MKIFISSTCYDLIDVRAELGTMLIEMGITPLLSDDKLSDFRIEPQANSIATCLVNVEKSDAVIVILNQRYGPRLKKAGFDDVSATHLEYRHARKKKLPIYFFARDRLIADHSIWVMNERLPEFQGAWAVTDHDRQGLFEFLGEHRKLTADSQGNWCLPFTSSVDLRDAIRKQLEPSMSPKTLLDLLSNDRFPILELTGSVIAGEALRLVLQIANEGGTPAFDVSLSHTAGEFWGFYSGIPVLKAGSSRSQQHVLTYPRMPQRSSIQVRYRSHLGFAVIDSYDCEFDLLKGMQFTAKLTSRRYERDVGPQFNIE